MKFTKEEISLCKQMAEKHGKEIKYGDWYYYSITKNCLVNAPRGTYLSEDEIERKNITPLWTISDCLEWLKERYDDINIARLGNENWEIETEDSFNKVHYINHIIAEGKTPLEACLKAVLVVLEEK